MVVDICDVEEEEIVGKKDSRMFFSFG